MSEFRCQQVRPTIMTWELGGAGSPCRTVHQVYGLLYSALKIKDGGKKFNDKNLIGNWWPAHPCTLKPYTQLHMCR